MRADAARVRARRGRRGRRTVGRDERARGGVRRRARPQHADLGGGDHRYRDRRRAVGAAAGGRDHVRRLRHARARPAREPGCEGALHVRRPAHGAPRPAHAGRRRPARRCAALPEARGMADPRTRPEGGDAEHGRRRSGLLRAAIADPNPVVVSRTRRSTGAEEIRCPRRPSRSAKRRSFGRDEM